MIETVGDIIRNNAYKFPDEIAYSYQGRVVTFAEQLERGNRLASALWQRGIRRQDRVSILSQNTVEFMECYAACELAGYMAATVNWRLAAPEISYILNDSTPRVLVFEAQYAATVDRIRDKLPSIEFYLCFGGEAPDWAEDYEQFLVGGDQTGAPTRPRPDAIMHLIYTSGDRPAEGRDAHAQGGDRDGHIDGDGTRPHRFRQAAAVMPIFHVGARFLQLAVHIRGGNVVLIVSSRRRSSRRSSASA